MHQPSAKQQAMAIIERADYGSGQRIDLLLAVSCKRVAPCGCPALVTAVANGAPPDSQGRGSLAPSLPKASLIV